MAEEGGGLMKPGLSEGQEAVIETVVTPEMFAQFDRDIIHRTFSTVSMVYYMEWASRKLILPFLEPGEEGMGVSVSVKHIKPALEGATIRFTAVIREIKGSYVISEVEAKRGPELIGIGTVKQVILPLKTITEKLKER